MANPTNLSISLIEREDANGDSYYIGSVNYDFPMLVDLSKIDFLIFHPPDGVSENEDEDDRRYATLVIRRGTRNRDRDRG